MLEAIRKNVTGILAKILIGLLVVSFAVWGIGDMVRTYGQDVVATVGDQSIKTREFRNAYQLQMDGFSQQFRRRLTPQEAKAFGIEQQVISRLTGAAAVDNHAGELNLDISDQDVEKSVYRDTLFHGIDGSFSPQRLQEVLRHSGYTEKQFFEARKRDSLRNQITNSMLSNMIAPKAMTSMLQTYRDEKRIADYIEITPAKAVKLGEPTEEQLKKTYEDNKRRFVTPEFRKFEALLLTAKAAKAKIEISDADLKTVYEADKLSFATPEERRIQQIAFQDEAAANAAKAEIAAGKSFMDVAKATGAKESDVNLGMLSQTALIDKAIAAAAFGLKKDEVSAPVKGRFKTMLLRITEIKEGEQRTFDQVKEDIRRQIETERVAEKIQEIQNQIDDNRLAGKSLKEISELLKLPFVEVAATDREGNSPEAKPAFTAADKDRLINKAFAAEVGVENEVLELSNDGLAWLNLIAVTPEKQKPYKDVTTDVKKTWVEIETRNKLREVSNALAKRINDGATLEAIAKELDVKVKKTPAFKRGDSVPDLTQPAVARVFTLKKDAATSVPGEDAERRIVVKLVEVQAPEKLTDAAAKALRQQTENQLRADIVAQYVSDLQKRMEVSINQPLIDQTTGVSIPNAPYQ